MFRSLMAIFAALVLLLSQLVRRELGPDVFDRRSGLLVREREPLSAWIINGIMYSWPVDVLDHTGGVRRWLKRHTWRTKKAHTTYASALAIPAFVDFYGVRMADFVQDNPSSFRTFNEFFIRQVRPELRPAADHGIISVADSRLSVFDTVREASRLFIKGRRFSLATLLGGLGRHDDLLRRFGERCHMANFRLHPMDYHRFHSPVDGRISVLDHIPGEYYTVKTAALRSPVNVLCENTRTVMVIETGSRQGAVLFVAIGAEDVGSVSMGVELGQQVSRGQELGLFQYGGSDIVVVFERDIIWDVDLVRWSKKSVESLVRVNEHIGEFCD